MKTGPTRKNMASSSNDENGKIIPAIKKQRLGHDGEEARSSNSSASIMALVGPPIKDSLELVESFVIEIDEELLGDTDF